MTARKPLSSEEISAIVDGFDPIDWVQVRLPANTPPGKRIYPSLQASAMIRTGRRTSCKRKFPNLSPSETHVNTLNHLILMDGKYVYA